MQEPQRAAEAHRRVPTILASADRMDSRAGQALVSKAMLMHLWAGGSRQEILPVARWLLHDGRLAEGDGADSQALWHVIGTLSWCDDYAAAGAALRVAFADAQRRGSVIGFVVASQLRARQGLWTGPVADAVQDARAAVEVFRAGVLFLPAAGYCLVCGLLEQGDTDSAAATLELVDQQRPPPQGFFAAWRHMAAGRLAAAQGEDAQAVEAFLATGRRLTEMLAVNPTVLPWRSEAGLASRRLGQHDTARMLIEQELALAERFGGPRALGVASRAAGLLERGPAAFDRLQRAVELLDGCGARVEQARALIELGATIRRGGRPAEARPPLREALKLAAAAGADALAERARAELQVAGGRAPAARVGGAADRLTPSERRIARLAAAGQTNRQIADALFVTVKAVEWHLGNAYRKLDARGRVDLPTRLAARSDGV